MNRNGSLFIFISIKRKMYRLFVLKNYNVFVAHFKIISAININCTRENSFMVHIE